MDEFGEAPMYGGANQDAEAILTRMAELMTAQHEDLTKILVHQQQLMEAWRPREAEKRVEGISMPTYHGKMTESLQVFLQQAQLYFSAKNIDVDAPENQARLIAMVASNLKSQAAAWYTFYQGKFKTVSELANALQKEFVPADLQERLRAELYELRQSRCTGLEDYIAKFRQIICQVEQMSVIDQITWFVHGLTSRTREEVTYRRCDSLSRAMAVALEFECSHPRAQTDRERGVPAPRPRRDEAPLPRDEAEPMEIGNVNVRLSRDECRRRNLCFKCQRSGHRQNQCRSRPQANQWQRSRHGGPRNRRSINTVAIIPREPEVATGTETVTFPAYNVNMVEVHCPHSTNQNQLIRKTVIVEGVQVVALLDCGANHNLIRPGLLTSRAHEHRASVEGFDGRVADDVVLREREGTVCLDGRVYRDLKFTEYDLPPAHDVILGKPWFTKYNPRIDWRTHDVKLPPETSVDVLFDMSNGYLHAPLRADKLQLYHVKIVPDRQYDEVCEPIARLVETYRDVFPESLPSGLPPERAVEFELELKPDARPSSRAPFRLSKTEQDALKIFVQDLLDKQWIEISSSPWVSNVFGVPKKDPATGKAPSRSEWIRNGDPTSPIRWVVDYRYLNSQTLIPKIPLPNIEELFDRMASAVVFSVLDLAQGYHQMRVKPATRPYTAFRTGSETYQWCVAPMGVAGMPGLWSRLMRLLFDRFDFVVVYLDDICVYSRSMDEHVDHLRQVFEVLKAEQLYVRLSKCVFGKPAVDFLGHTISNEGLRVDQKKTSVIEQWQRPTSVKELQSFMGLAGYYRRFIHRFADIVLPLSNLIKKDCKWEWGPYQENAFLVIKAALQQAPILRLPDFSKRFVVTTDASHLCCGAVLSQRHDGFDHPLAFYSKKFGKHEINWPAHEKELYAIKLALGKWHHYLHGRPFDIYTDNIACRWFLHHPNVSAKLARWLDFFAQFDFELHHVKGVQNIVADALSRHIECDQHPSAVSDTPDSMEPMHRDNSTEVVVNTFTLHHCAACCVRAQEPVHDRQRVMNDLAGSSAYDLHLLLDDQSRGEVVVSHADQPQRVGTVVIGSTELTATTVNLDDGMRDAFADGYRRDPAYAAMSARSTTQTSDGTLYRRDGLIFLECGDAIHRLCVPSVDDLRTAVLSEFHDGAAHPGAPRTLSKLSQWYYWDGMSEDVTAYVNSCLTCKKFKSSSKKRNGMLIPNAVPTECWQHVGVDFISGLPVSRGYDCIMVAVDLLSKRAKYAPTHSTATAPECARVFFDAVVRHHGLPSVIISDRDSRFTAAFWQELMSILGVRLHMTTAHRAQADGQVERQNRVLEDALRCLTAAHGRDWVNHLGTAEYAHATLTSASTRLTPFEIDCGRKAENPIGHLGDRNEVTAAARTKAEYAKQFVERRREVVEQARQNLLDAKERQKRYYDKKRAEPDFKAGDMVLLKTAHIPLKQVAHDTELKKAKLKAQAIGPFRIEYMVNENVARLKLPRQLKRLHPSFNVELLELYPDQPARFQSRPAAKHSPIELADAEADNGMRVIERLLKRRQFNRKPEYLVKWLGEPESESTWEREKDLKHVVHWNRLVKELREQSTAKDSSSGGGCQPRTSSSPSQSNVMTRAQTHSHIEAQQDHSRTHIHDRPSVQRGSGVQRGFGVQRTRPVAERHEGVRTRAQKRRDERP